MDLLDAYRSLNLDSQFKALYCTTSTKRMLYRIKTTTLRTIFSYTNIFDTFLEVEGKEPDLWPVKKTTQQQIHKQFPEPMREAKLFYRNKDGAYYRTEKGKNYKKFIDESKNPDIFTESEAWLINFLYIMDSYTDMVDYYLVNRSQQIYDNWNKIFPSNTLEQYMETFLKNYKSANNVAKFVFSSPITYLHCFYDADEFLNYFKTATEPERERLYSRIYYNYNEVPRDNKDVLSKFYSNYDDKITGRINGGAVGLYTFNMLYDDIRIMYCSLILNKYKAAGIDTMFGKLFSVYKQWHIDFNVDKVVNFIRYNANVLNPIFDGLCHNNTMLETDNTYGLLGPEEICEDHPYEYIDTTTEIGMQEANQQFARAKELAKRLGDYKCALEKLYQCNNYYFTSKTSTHHYLEVHHFLPREFRNEFEYSIEVMANYIPLCPRCHKMLHNAIDDERRVALNFLYNERMKRLDKCGLHLEEMKLWKLYHFDRT